MLNEAMSGPETILYIMFFSLVTYQSISRPGCFLADVTSVGDPRDMVCLYVIRYISQLAFFSTHFANQYFSFLIPHDDAFSTVFYHGPDLIIQLLEIHTN